MVSVMDTVMELDETAEASEDIFYIVHHSDMRLFRIWLNARKNSREGRENSKNWVYSFSLVKNKMEIVVVLNKQKILILSWTSSDNLILFS